MLESTKSTTKGKAALKLQTTIDGKQFNQL